MTANPRHTTPACATSSERGAALIEMAFVLPLMLMVFFGIVEFSQYIATKERANRIANQVAGVLYSVRTDEINANNFTRYVENAMAQAEELAHPYPAPYIAVRFCEVTSIGQILKGYADNNEKSCGDVAEKTCQGGAISSKGYGSFVQVHSCLEYEPAILPSYFTQGEKVEAMAYFPSTSSNLSAQAAEYGSGGNRTPDDWSAPTTPDDSGGGDDGTDGGGDDSGGTGPEDEEPEDTCPSGQSGSPPNCCPSGMVATPSGACITEPCPAGTYRVGENCAVSECTSGASNYPDCDTCGAQQYKKPLPGGEWICAPMCTVKPDNPYGSCI